MEVIMSELQNAVLRYRLKHGQKAAQKLIKQHGGTNLGSVPEDRREALLAASTEAAASEVAALMRAASEYRLRHGDLEYRALLRRTAGVELTARVSPEKRADVLAALRE